MTSHDPRFDDLAAVYALDALDDIERAAYERHLAACSACSEEVAAHREVVGFVADATEVAPPAHLRDQILDAVEREPRRSVPTRSRSRFDMRVVAAAAAAVILVIAGVFVVRGDDDGVTVDQLLASADSTTWTLAGDPGELDIVWSPSHDHVAVIGQSVSAPGPGRSFQLWMVHDDGVSSAGVIEVDDSMVSFVHVTPDAQANGWLVSDEPAGGSTEPTGDIVFSRKA